MQGQTRGLLRVALPRERRNIACSSRVRFWCDVHSLLRSQTASACFVILSQVGSAHARDVTAVHANRYCASLLQNKVHLTLGTHIIGPVGRWAGSDTIRGMTGSRTNESNLRGSRGRWATCARSKRLDPWQTYLHRPRPQEDGSLTTSQSQAHLAGKGATMGRNPWLLLA